MSVPANDGGGSESPPRRPDLSILRADDEYEYRPRRGRYIKWGVLVVLATAAVITVYRAPLDQWVPFLMPQVETTTVQRLTPEQASTVLTATGYTYARVRAAVGAGRPPGGGSSLPWRTFQGHAAFETSDNLSRGLCRRELVRSRQMDHDQLSSKTGVDLPVRNPLPKFGQDALGAADADPSRSETVA